MKILMFGWEFPPYASGGLGTACFGMTKALVDLGQEVLFVMPISGADDASSHVRLIPAGDRVASDTAIQPERFLIRSVDSPLRPYMSNIFDPAASAFPPESFLAASGGYDGNLIDEVLRYAKAASVISATESFDVIHAHDWMTAPAALSAKEQSGKPLIFHVHSLEYDRSGEAENRQIKDLELCGLKEADAVIAVSRYTKNIIVKRYGIAPEKIFVVHNAVIRKERRGGRGARKDPAEKTVLFLGRITFQKGPDYFIEAARRVLHEMPQVSFVMAGSGDMMPRMIERVAELNMGSKFRFTGFLRDEEVEEILAASDLFVMPSVSEPFGIAPLEAMMSNIPVIISKQSGVAEIVRHALKVDFWDVDELANKIVAVLKYPPLTGELVSGGREELRDALWEKAAEKIIAIYEQQAAAAAGRR